MRAREDAVPRCERGLRRECRVDEPDEGERRDLRIVGVEPERCEIDIREVELELGIRVRVVRERRGSRDPLRLERGR